MWLPSVATDGPYQVVDLHVDTPWKVHFKKRPLSLPEGHATLPMLKKGHYIGIVYPIYIPDYIHDNDPRIADADAIHDTIDKLVAAHDDLSFAAEGKPAGDAVAAYVAIEGAGAFASDIEQIDRFIARGVRLVGPVHAHDNKLATSATGSLRYGLTDLGKRFCERVYRAGALVDASHMSDRAFADLVPIAKAHGAPIVATHSNARAVVNNRRNLTDEQLRAIAASTGVAGLNFHSSFVTSGRARIKHLVKQVRHMVAVAGVRRSQDLRRQCAAHARLAAVRPLTARMTFCRSPASWRAVASQIGKSSPLARSRVEHKQPESCVTWSVCGLARAVLKGDGSAQLRSASSDRPAPIDPGPDRPRPRRGCAPRLHQSHEHRRMIP
jgi:membrane dipeptidase